MGTGAKFTGLAVACLMLLSGCFISETPLIGYWRSDTPIADGVYAHWPVSPDGEEWESATWQGEIESQRRKYRSPEDGVAHQNLRLYELYTDLYLAQVDREDGSAYGIVWLYDEGRVISYHQAECGALSDALLAENDMVLDPEGFCRVDDLDQLEQIMRVYLETLGSDIRIDGIYRRVD